MAKDTPILPKQKPPGRYSVVIPNWQGVPVDENGKALLPPLRDPRANGRRTRPGGGTASGLDDTGFHDL